MVDEVGDVRDGVSEPAPAAESVESGAGDPSASPRVMGSDDAATDPPTKARGDFTLPLLTVSPMPELLLVGTLGWSTRGAGL